MTTVRILATRFAQTVTSVTAWSLVLDAFACFACFTCFVAAGAASLRNIAACWGRDFLRSYIVVPSDFDIGLTGALPSIIEASFTAGMVSRIPAGALGGAALIASTGGAECCSDP